MEIGFHPQVPTYSGGLGVLAGDTVRSAADLSVPMVAVTPLHRKGYFVQELDDEGHQREHASQWNVEEFLDPMQPVVCVELERRKVFIRCWRYVVKGCTGGDVPVFLLDTNLPENQPEDRTLTDQLYGGDARYRLSQEIVLGIGGLRMLRALGHLRLEKFHLNEGHAALLTVELLNERLLAKGNPPPSHEDIAAIRQQCVFTTHTPVAAGHDQFPMALVDQVLGRQDLLRSHSTSIRDGHLNMTYLALNLSAFTNAVAKRHGQVSRIMFPEYAIDSITNGVHAGTWTSEPFANLFDRHLQDWRQDNFMLRHALRIPMQEVWDAHMQAKQSLIEFVNSNVHAEMNPDAFTIGFARRAATYKRADLLLSDVERLEHIAENSGPIQIIYSGKAHPRDGGGKEVIHRVHQAMKRLSPNVKAVYIPNYEMTLGRLITAGVDVWLNTPQRPLEASGTSGMKAALNGVPSLSILDGWWVEGCIEGITGWAIGPDFPPQHAGEHDSGRDAADMYDKLEREVLPVFHNKRDKFIYMMRQSIAVNGAYFNTQRMVQKYAVKAYWR